MGCFSMENSRPFVAAVFLDCSSRIKDENLRPPSISLAQQVSTGDPSEANQPCLAGINMTVVLHDSAIVKTCGPVHASMILQAVAFQSTYSVQSTPFVDHTLDMRLAGSPITIRTRAFYTLQGKVFIFVLRLFLLHTFLL